MKEGDYIGSSDDLILVGEGGSIQEGELHLGDEVKLNSGSPKMKVCDFLPNGRVLCCLFYEGKVIIEDFPLAGLQFWKPL